MTDMKCPFCGQELLLSSFRMGEKDYQMWNCLRCEFSAYRKIWDKIIHIQELLDIESAEHEMCHTQMLKTTEKLERTRKALDVAVDALKDTNGYLYGDYRNTKWDLHKTIRQALEQITALEQINQKD